MTWFHVRLFKLIATISAGFSRFFLLTDLVQVDLHLIFVIAKACQAFRHDCSGHLRYRRHLLGLQGAIKRLPWLLHLHRCLHHRHWHDLSIWLFRQICDMKRIKICVNRCTHDTNWLIVNTFILIKQAGF